jgi:hypothetical protein
MRFLLRLPSSRYGRYVGMTAERKSIGCPVEETVIYYPLTFHSDYSIKNI